MELLTQLKMQLMHLLILLQVHAIQNVIDAFLSSQQDSLMKHLIQPEM
jgi:hypothetical protein